MQPLSASDLLNVWERGLAQAQAQRALSLLAAAHPRMPVEDLAELSVGQRDARLLTLREWIFGSQLASLADCPGCGERLELSFNVSDVRVASETELTAPLALEVAGYEVSFRLPNSLDLLALANDHDADAARQRLLARCLLAARQAGTAVTIDQLSAEVTAAIAERMGQADPQTDVQLALTCPACGHQWQAAFDIVSFFWSEIHAWADRTLREVHTLASVYGWPEADIPGHESLATATIPRDGPQILKDQIMHDFLARLATRSLDPSLGIQPRLPTLFEPLHATEEPVSGFTSGLEPTENEPGLGAVEEVPPLTQPSPPSATLSQPAETGLKPLFSHHESEVAPLATVPPPSAVRHPVMPQQEAMATPSPSRRESTGPMTLQPAVPPFGVQPNAPLLEPQSTAINEEAAPVALPGVTVKESQPASEARVERVAMERVAPPEELRPLASAQPRSVSGAHRTSAVVPNTAPSDSSRSGRSPQAPTPLVTAASVVAEPRTVLAPPGEPVMSAAAKVVSPEPAPTIRVTIGRIDVRAIRPPAPPRAKKTRPGPVLSLNDYLKQRREGRR